MKSYTYNKKDFENKLVALDTILYSNEDLDIDILTLKKKVHDVMESLQADTIKIVLLGSYSDGKTSTVAGLLSKVEDNMKIDPDESSDELVVYHPSSLKKALRLLTLQDCLELRKKRLMVATSSYQK